MANEVQWVDFAPVFFFLTSSYLVVQGIAKILQRFPGTLVKRFGFSAECGVSVGFGTMLTISAAIWITNPGSWSGQGVESYIRDVFGVSVAAIVVIFVLLFLFDENDLIGFWKRMRRCCIGLTRRIFGWPKPKYKSTGMRWVPPPSVEN